MSSLVTSRQSTGIKASNTTTPKAVEMKSLSCSCATRTGKGARALSGGGSIFLAMAQFRSRALCSPLGDEAGGGAQSIGLRAERRQRGIGLGHQSLEASMRAGAAQCRHQRGLAGGFVLV